MNDDTRPIDPTKAAEAQTLKHGRQLLGCRFSPCGQYVFAAGTDRLIHRWHLDSGEHTALEGHASWIGALAFHAADNRLISADYIGGLRAWDYTAPQPKPLWSVDDAHTGAIRVLAISSAGQKFATTGHDGRVRLWSLADGKHLADLAGHDTPVFAMAFHPDGVNLVSADLYGNVQHWDVATGKPVRNFDAAVLWSDASLDNGAHACGVRSLSFDREGSLLAAAGITELKDGDRRGGNATVLLFDWAAGTLKERLEAKGAGYVERAVVHPAGFVLAACLTQERGSLQFWKLGGEEPLHSLKSDCRDLDLHPDGTRIAAAEFELDGKGGNNESTKNLEEYKWSRGVVRIFALTPPEAPAAAES